MKIGIIGGSGLDDPNLLENYESKEIETPYGKPSSELTCGKIEGVDVCILARHGKTHNIPPSNVNFRANIWTLKQEGCDFILAATAVGSLREEVRPGNLVFPNQFIDFTKQRKMSFYDQNDGVVHTPMAEPFDKVLRGFQNFDFPVVEWEEYPAVAFQKLERSCFRNCQGGRLRLRSSGNFWR